MFLSKLCIDQHGECLDLCIDSVTPGLNVIHGTQASGKSKAVEFLRSTLYGFDPDFLPRYSPDEHGRFDGTLTLIGPHGRRTIHRESAHLTIESDSGDATDANALQELRELHGDLSPRFLEQIFVVDFERPPSAVTVLNQASQYGFDVEDRVPNAARLEEVERNLAETVRQLKSLPEPSETWERLVDRRRQILDEIASLETRERRRTDEHEHQQTLWNSRLAEFEYQLNEARREMAALDTTISRLLEQRQQLELERAKLSDQRIRQPWSDELSKIDAQLSRWQLVLHEMSLAKNDAASGRLGSLRSSLPGEMPASDSRRYLTAIESTTLQLQKLLSLQNTRRSPSCSCHDFHEVLDDSLQQMRKDVYQLCHTLNVWQIQHQQQILSAQSQQFARCESELQLAIQSLTDRRQRFLNGLERPESTLRPDHHEFCDCVGHLRLVDASTERKPFLDSLNAALAECDAELRRAEQQRNQIEQQIADINERFQQAKQTAHPNRTDFDGTQNDLNAKRVLLALVEQSISQWARRRESLTHVDCFEEELHSLHSQSAQSLILSEASQIARQLSADAIQQIGRDAHGQVWVETSCGTLVKWHELADGDRDQATLAVHFALAAACERRGAQLPLVVKSPFSNSSDSQVSDAIRFLRSFAQGRQILCFTSDEHAVQAARAANVRVGILTLRSNFVPPATKVETSSDVTSRETGRFNSNRERNRNEASRDHIPSGQTSEAAADSVQPRIRTADSAANREQEYDSSDTLSDDVWTDDDPIEHFGELSAPDAGHLRRAGVHTIREFLETPVDDLAERLRGTRLTRERLLQKQSYGRRRSRSRRDWSRVERTPHYGERSDRETTSGDRSSRTARPKTGVEGNRTMQTNSSSAPTTVIPMSARDGSLRFFLHRRDLVDAAPSIGSSMAQKLSDIGIVTVADLLDSNPESAAAELGHSPVKADTIRQWQRQAELVCRIPQLRGHDAQILVAINMINTEELAAATPADIWIRVKRFMNTDDCKRILRGGSPPNLEEVTKWIAWSQKARPLAAA